MLRIEVGDLPGVDVADAAFVIGSDPNARIRLPASEARAEHVRVDGDQWHAIGPVSVDGAAATGGAIGSGVTLQIGSYKLRVSPSPAGATPAPPQRTESLARELVRAMLGTAGAPTLEIERGPNQGAKRSLPPPESALVIGRGDDAGWIIADDDLSRMHAEVRRSWDGTRIVDLESKNGTKVDGVRVGADGIPLRDGAAIELGNLIVRFRDPAEKHLGGAPRAQTAAAPVAPAPAAPFARASATPFYIALAVMLLALGAIAWLVSL